MKKTTKAKDFLHLNNKPKRPFCTQSSKMQALGLGPMPSFARDPALPASLRGPPTHSSTNLPAFSLFSSLRTRDVRESHGTRFLPRASSSSDLRAVVGGPYVEEPATKVKFQTFLSFPGCSTPLTLIGAGYREKVFAIIGVKVYAAALYTNQSISNILTVWKGRSVADVEKDDLLFKSFFEAPLEKSLQIILVRDIDGKTFWDALDDAIAPRIKAPTSEDESALSMFRSIFQGKSLKRGNSIFLTWPDPSRMMVSVSSNGLPSDIAATIESANASSALFDVFFGNAPVSPSLKNSVASGLASMLK